MEESESTDYLSDDNGEDIQDTEINPGILSHNTSSHTPPGSEFPSHHAPSLTPSESYPSSHNLSPLTTTRSFSVTDNEFTAHLPAFQDSNQLFNSTSSNFFNQDDNYFASDNQALNRASFTQSVNSLKLNDQASILDTPWNMAQSSPPAQKGDDAMMGVEAGPEKPGSTLILENVQPQMVTGIINMMYEAKSVVKMRIVSQE